MKNRRTVQSITAFIISILFVSSSLGQSTGYITRPTTSVVTSAGRAILDVNNNGYTSVATTGFAGNDVANSEIPYRSIPSFSTEPFGDLRRGPNHLYSDFVPDANNVGYYAYLDASNNFLFRFRMGSIMPGSKGYSVLLDTDGKFGATGANADPDFQPATTGTNGNPGFEVEIVLETNKRIAIYNVAGSSTATFVKEYTNWQDMSQVSVAGTFDNGDPDFFIDFYIPFSDLQAAPFNLTTATSIRMSATTVMSPQAAIGGPKSDIYGLNDAGYKSTNDQYEAYINAQPSFTPASLNTGGLGAMCTAAPIVNSPITSGTITLSGTWTKSSLTGSAGTANITIYKNGVSVGTANNITSGSTWSLSNVTLINGDVITAKAQATGESMCLVSNSVTASTCNTSNRPALPILSCYSTSKGITGTNLSTGWTIHVDNITRNTTDNNVTNSGSLFATPTGTSPNLTWTYSNGCTSGSPLTSGSYKVYYTNNSNGCSSEPAYVCVAGNGGSALAGSLAAPTITSPSNGVYTTATNSITGTTDANASLALYVNGAIIQTTTASAGGAFNFSNLKLLSGQQLYIVAELNTGTVTTSKCAAQTATAVVSCFTTPPVINTDNNGQILIGAAITGTSGEPAGTTIKVYTSPANTLVATTTVQSGGTWSTANAGTTPATYNAVSGIYYATATNGTCGVSTASGNAAAVAATSGRCGTITSPVTTSSSSIGGTLTGSVTNSTVNLYQDGQLIGTTATSGTSWSILASNLIYPLYNNGILTIGVREGTTLEQSCSTSVAVSCSTGPVTPNVNPPTSSVTQGQTQTYTINNAVIGAFYGISDATTGQSLGTGIWANSSTVTLTTNSVSNGAYTVNIKGTSLSGVSVCSSSPGTASLLVTTALPVTLIDFTGKKKAGSIVLSWVTENEENTRVYEVERSGDGVNYSKLSEKSALNSRNKTTYSLVDEQPLATNYYRLRIIDLDGKYTYSKVVLINQNGTSSLAVQPNPFSSAFTINLTLPANQFIKIQLLDVNGRLIKSKNLTALPGLNRITFDQVQELRPGIYLLRVYKTDGILEQKLIKANE